MQILEANHSWKLTAVKEAAISRETGPDRGKSLLEKLTAVKEATIMGPGCPISWLIAVRLSAVLTVVFRNFQLAAVNQGNRTFKI